MEKSVSNKMFDLFRINFILIKRSRKREHIYLFLVALASFFPMSFWIVLLYTKVFHIESEHQMQIAFNVGILFVFAVDVLFTLLRFQGKTLLEPFHLSIFPIGNLQKLKFNFVISIMDHKSLVYLIVTILLAVFFLKELSLSKALLSAVIILTFLLTMTTWFHIAYRLCGDFFRRTKSNVLVIFYFGVIFFNVALITKRMDLFGSMPFVSHIGNALYALKTDNRQAVLTNSLFLGLFLVSGIIVLAFLATRRPGNPYLGNYSE